MKFTTALDFFKALTENNGVLWCENGYVIDLNKEESIAILGMFLLQFKKREFFTTPPLKDKDLVWCWDDPCCAKIVTFFDSKSNCSFHPSGKRCGNVWGNYELFTGEWPEWAKEAVKTLED